MFYLKASQLYRPLLLLSLLALLGAASVHRATGSFESQPSRAQEVSSPDEFSGVSAESLQQRQSPLPAVILRRMLSRYRTVKSYEATGSTTKIDLDIAQQTSKDIPFTLSFKRPRYMRLEWINNPMSSRERKSALWSSGKQARLDVFPNVLNKVTTLEDALRTASVLSGVAPYIVAHLLIYDADTKSKIVELKHLKQLDSKQIAGEDCYVIAGDLPGDVDASFSYKFWIGKKDYLIRKFQETLRTSDKTRAEVFISEEFHTNIKINGEIPNSVFDYQPASKPKGQEATH